MRGDHFAKRRLVRWGCFSIIVLGDVKVGAYVPAAFAFVLRCVDRVEGGVRVERDDVDEVVEEPLAPRGFERVRQRARVSSSAAAIAPSMNPSKVPASSAERRLGG